jgi:flagellar basal-body rod protein FlgB
MSDELFGIHAQALKLKARRAQVLASNIANADTPGYKARDFDFREVLRKEMGQPMRMNTTHRSHLQMESGIVPPSQIGYRIPSQPSLDGNTVDTQQEYAAFAANALEYQASLRFLDGAVSKLKLAIKGQ